MFVTTEDGTAVQLTPSPRSCPNSDEQQSRTFNGGRDKVQQQLQQQKHKQQLLFSQQDLKKTIYLTKAWSDLISCIEVDVDPKHLTD